ncbi:MAG: hypothetical protein ACOVQA_03420, partial [Thermoflexibacteraceae bacterium]
MLLDNLTKTSEYTSPMKKFVAGLLCFGVMSLQSCGDSTKTTTNENPETTPKVAQGGRYYGGT